ncbi:hypothetical protein HYU12_04365 [Candidatus Woesearchaeota archaeon]|nr:hypothetical protein [Candidatus Woesearchaeota archaeon]
MVNVVKFQARVEKVVVASPRVKLFTLSVPEGFSFIPGQFVVLSVQGYVDDKGLPVARSYSIASSPLVKNGIELCISIVPDGRLSSRLDSLKIGDEVSLTGPYGMFTLKSPVEPGTVFIAGGAGIAPIISMLRTLCSGSAKAGVALYYGIRNPDEFLYREELSGYVKRNGIKVVAVVSDNNSGWSGERGYVADVLHKFLKSPSKAYVCGPPLMVSETVKKLVELDFRMGDIYREQW